MVIFQLTMFANFPHNRISHSSCFVSGLSTVVVNFVSFVVIFISDCDNAELKV